MKWVAEFSDPILLDIHGKTRISNIDDHLFLETANKRIQNKHKLPPVTDKNLFFWCNFPICLLTN